MAEIDGSSTLWPQYLSSKHMKQTGSGRDEHKHKEGQRGRARRPARSPDRQQYMGHAASGALHKQRAGKARDGTGSTAQ